MPLITSEWSMFRHDRRHSGTSGGTAPNSAKLKWKFSTGASVCSSPAVAEGKVYIMSYDQYLYCLDAVTGANDWKKHLKAPMSWYGGGASSPAVDQMVYVGCRDENVYCLSRIDGSIIWKFKMGLQAGPSIDGMPISIDCTDSSPTVADFKVYIGSGDHNVYCLHWETGKLIWKYCTGAGINSSPAVVGGRVYIGSYDGMLYCLDAQNGKFIWKFPTGPGLFFGKGVDCAPAIGGALDNLGRRVYIGAHDGNVYCLAAKSGKPIWKFKTGWYISSSPAIDRDRVYIGSGDYNVYCLAAKSGELIWKFPTGWGVHSSPAVVDDKVYIGSYDDKFYCLDAKTGKPKWSYVAGPVYSSPAVANGEVYVGSNWCDVLCFN